MSHVVLNIGTLRTLSCAVLTTAVLAACGGGSGGGGSANPTQPSAPGNPSTGNPSTPTNPGPTPAPTPENPSPTAPGPFGHNAAQWTPTFADEFNGNSLNTAVWNDAIWYESSNPTRNYAVEDGKLKIWPQRDASGNFFNRTIDTDGKYYQTYGYFEIEAKLPNGKGTWPAFWLFNHDTAARPEIDIMEAYAGGSRDSWWSDGNNNPTNFGATLWRDNGGAENHLGEVKLRDLSQYSAGVRLDQGFHKYGAFIEPDGVTFYFDGQQMGNKMRTNYYNMRMYILLDLWFGSASGQPDNSTPTGKGNSFEVNYVRAWQKK